MELFYLMQDNMRIAKKFDEETVSFLVDNGYATFYRTINFDTDNVHYYKPNKPKGK